MKDVNAALPAEKLLEQLSDKYSITDRELILRAYNFAKKAHGEQKRHSGEPYINHCVAVASILAELNVPCEALVAGLLHDTVEDTEVTLADIRGEFGEAVKYLVDGVTKLTQIPRVSRGDQHNGQDIETEKAQTTSAAAFGRKEAIAHETLRKTFLAMGEDVRVVLIKLADRLHNMRTLGHMPEHKRKRIAQETLEIFAPLANRLGIWPLKWELEDLAFRYVNPEKYKEIAEQLDGKRPEREAQMEEIKTNLLRLLEKNNIHAEISGRPKHIYSIYKKMLKKDKPFDMVRDVRAVRLIVPDVISCYSALGVIHTTWRPLRDEFDDYIATPKDNFYQSLHTAVVYDDKRPLEVQIRTPEMHMNAEYGIAAHWVYKEGGKQQANKNYEQRINTLRSMMDWRTEVNDATEFVEAMKMDVFQDRVYIFTPRGDIIDLPAGSTPIDFAYQVHTDIGHRCRGARINGKLVPLYHELKTGDQVDILTTKRGGPSRDWLNPNLGLVKTSRTRAKIKNWFKKQQDEQNLAQGRTIVEREIQRLGLKDQNYEDLAKHLGYKTFNEFFIDLGRGELALNKVIRELAENDEGQDILAHISGQLPDSTSTDAIEVVGLKGMLSNMAKCCNPMPGDQIVGYITRGRGATIHRQDCPNILKTEDRERLLQVDWGHLERTYPIPIKIRAYDRQGLTSDITTLLNSEGVNILNITVGVNKSLAELRLIVEVKNLTHLSRILTRIENLPNVLEAVRTHPG
ncbi:MAG: bifunctional (p)ppGpp synthetase/guanosine-3',5'-bis(diphosphate) 3'-pyrophosphohydrolase [Anaerolineales bacterium]|nr:bifunctional (p)ppGpp synthetase/guanosine-3',5'-bis(diphosphate) 3'-pyrophosphohydrolase [Anaerolineales bacterium]